jgi:hypothetical protein
MLQASDQKEAEDMMRRRRLLRGGGGKGRGEGEGGRGGGGAGRLQRGTEQAVAAIREGAVEAAAFEKRAPVTVQRHAPAAPP